jgi:hypothetical protein
MISPAINQREADNIAPILNLAIKIGSGERRMSKTSDLNHVSYHLP